MINPIRDNVYITPIFDIEKTNSGLYVPDQAKDRCDQGIVKYVGPDVLDIKMGDFVLFPNYAGTLMQVSGEGYIIIMPEQTVTAVISNVFNGLVIPHLFMEDSDGTKIPATYEFALTLLSDAVQNSEWYKENRIHNRRRKAGNL